MRTRILTINCLVKWFLPFYLFTFLPLNAQVGTWKNHLAYHDVQNICEADHQLFVLASNDIYLYNKNDQSITTYDKVNGLSDTYITHIAWCPQAKRLIAVYQNSNIDLIGTNGDITNISALYSKMMTEDKTVSKITIDGIYAWLHCSFGLVKVNVKKAEIAETYTNGHPDYPTNLPDYDEYNDLQNNITLVSSLLPGGPKYNYFYEMKFYNKKLYTCGGLYQPLVDLQRPGTIQVLDENNNWTIYEDRIDTLTHYSYVDIDCIDTDPTDNDHVFAGGRTGLYEFLKGKLIKAYSIDNSELKSTFQDNLDKNYVIVNALQFDKEGNLWMVQSLNNYNKLLVLNKNGSWEKKDYDLFNTFGKALSGNNALGNARNLYFDSNDYLWFVHDHYDTPAIYRYDTKNNESKEFTSFINQDGNTFSIKYGVRCLAEDKDNNIWIGTSDGPLMLESTQIESNNPIFTQVKVPRNDGTNYADYLLAGIDITSIAIDGGNRKWFGTNNNGVFLISSDNLEQIQHFTTDNSSLISNSILSIAINHTTGEVFFATDHGLCSYISDATKTNQEMSTDNVWAYPNPVEPDYTGPITITGLSFNSDIKILSSSGYVVNEGRSNGGTYIWDGCDKKGKRVASGIYMVAIATNDGKKGTVCKIAIVN